MILKLKVKTNRKNNRKEITIWIQKNEEFDNDIKELFQFFKEQVVISNRRRLHKYYKINSNNPAIMMSLFSATHDLIPEVYFNDNNAEDIEEIPDLEANG